MIAVLFRLKKVKKRFPRTMFCSILDEEEMYEKGGPFTVEQLSAIAKFCNLFCFRVIWNGYISTLSFVTVRANFIV